MRESIFAAYVILAALGLLAALGVSCRPPTVDKQSPDFVRLYDGDGNRCDVFFFEHEGHKFAVMWGRTENIIQILPHE